MYCLAILRSWKQKNADNRFSFQVSFCPSAYSTKRTCPAKTSDMKSLHKKNMGELKPSVQSARPVKRLSKKQVSDPDHFKQVSFNTCTGKWMT